MGIKEREARIVEVTKALDDEKAAHQKDNEANAAKLKARDEADSVWLWRIGVAALAAGTFMLALSLWKFSALLDWAIALLIL